MFYTCAISFNDIPDVIYTLRIARNVANVIELTLDVMNPSTGLPVKVYFRRISSKGRSVYYYSEGSKAGNALGG
jgi:hypothetical protein